VERAHQIVLICSTILASCLGMQAVHELGHVLGAWATGAEVTRVVLTPTTFSRTDVAHNTRPLVVVWAGPIIGVVLPLLLWLIASLARMPGAFVLRFFAGFCLIANGLYIGLGSFEHIGDCGQMLRHGSPRALLWLFGLATTLLGLVLWHGLGASFGLGTAHRQISHRVTYATVIMCVLLILLGFEIGGH
jgi:hypothetical protein